MNVLNVHLPLVVDEPEDYTESYLSKVIAVPFPLVYDASYTLQGSSPIVHTVTTTTGISETDSTSYSHSVGLSITAEGGCELIGGSVSVTVSCLGQMSSCPKCQDALACGVHPARDSRLAPATART
jgi:hypothetical protein